MEAVEKPVQYCNDYDCNRSIEISVFFSVCVFAYGWYNIMGVCVCVWQMCRLCSA